MFKDNDYSLNLTTDLKVTQHKYISEYIITSAIRYWHQIPTENGSLESSQFSIVDNDAAVESSSGFITYSLETGNLFYNQNGAEEGLGDGSQFATLQGIPPLAETDFIIS